MFPAVFREFSRRAGPKRQPREPTKHPRAAKKHLGEPRRTPKARRLRNHWFYIGLAAWKLRSHWFYSGLGAWKLRNHWF